MLDQILFGPAGDLQRKLDLYKHYYNKCRSHKALNAATPTQFFMSETNNRVSINHYKWQLHCNGLFQLPIAA